MKTVSKYLLATCILAGFNACEEETAIQEYSVLPEPQQIEYVTGTFKVKDGISIAFPSELAGEAALLSQYLANDFDVKPVLKENKKKGDVTLLIDAATLPDQQEGYVLDVKKKQITIKANAPAGILYGIQTLRQLVRNETGNLLVQAGTITDYPAFSWRAFMLDEARYFFGKETVFRLLDNMAQLKMNVFHWHIVDAPGWRLEIKKYPDLTKIGAFRDSTEIGTWLSNKYDGKPHGGFYTQDEIREVVAYASARHITIVPEIEMPGHANAAIVAYPWLGSTGKKIDRMPCNYVDLDAFNVTDPKVVEFFHDVLTEVLALFPGKVIHIGGDEVPYRFWKDSPSISKYMKENGFKTPSDLQVDFTNKMSQWISSNNRRMIGWNDITGEKIHASQKDEAEVAEHLAPGTIVQFWRGDPSLIKKAIVDGYDIVNSYHVFTYLDYTYKKISLEKAYNFQPMPEGLTAEQQKKVLGLGCQMWTEWVPNEQNMNGKVYPRIAAYAETGWTSPDKKDYKRFLKTLDYFLTTWKQQGIEYGPID